MSIAHTPDPPYYAVIFSSIRNMEGDEAYQEMAIKMDELAKSQPGFLGFETVRGEVGISISYWEDLAAIKQWKMNVSHLEAQQKGKTEWYKKYQVRIAKVERAYSFDTLSAEL